MKTLKYLAGITFISFLAGIAFYLYAFEAKNVRPESFDLYVSSNGDYTTVIDSLIYKNALHNIWTFSLVAKILKYPSLVKPGRYVLTGDMSNKEIIQILRSGRQTPVKVTFNNISFFEELSSILSKTLESDSSAFSKYFLDEKNALQFGFYAETFRLMFLPDTYEFFWNTSPEKFSKKMFDNYKNFWTKDLITKAKAINLTPVEVGILASIVESETKKRDEMPTIAGLYLNRLRRNIPLQADPTVVYATQLQSGTRTRRVYLRDLKIDSPYNTYLYKGLPPGPILFPSKMAIISVLNAEQHDYLYMCADPDRPGYHLFTSNYQQHLQNASKYHRWLNAQRIN